MEEKKVRDGGSGRSNCKKRGKGRKKGESIRVCRGGEVKRRGGAEGREIVMCIYAQTNTDPADDAGSHR